MTLCTKLDRYAPSPKQAENRHSPQISPELTRDVVEEFFLFEWPIFCNFFIALSTEVYMWWEMLVPLQVMTFPTVDSSLLPMAHNATCKKIHRFFYILFTLLPPALKTTSTSNLSMATYGYCPHPHCLTVPAMANGSHSNWDQGFRDWVPVQETLPSQYHIQKPKFW